MSAIQVRRSTTLADARSRARGEVDARVEVRSVDPDVRVGRSSGIAEVSGDALAAVSGVRTAGSVAGVAGLVVGSMFTAAWGVLSYSLFMGKWIVTSRHPIWGVVTGFIALTAAAGTIQSVASSSDKA